MDHPSAGIKEVLLKKLKYVHTEGCDWIWHIKVRSKRLPFHRALYSYRITPCYCRAQLRITQIGHWCSTRSRTLVLLRKDVHLEYLPLLWFSSDCSRNCTTGTLNAACDACTCDHHVVTGRVLTINGAPLSEANISLAETPYNVLAQTNISGHFKALGVCFDEEEMLVTKEGFVPMTRRANVLTPTTATINVKMEIGGTPLC